MKRWNVLITHRRAGKTIWAINALLKAVFTCPHKNPRGYYIAPFYSQAKRVAWQYIKDFTRVIPGTIFNESELLCKLPNGACIQLLGAENAQSLRGLYSDFIVCDEYAQFSPRIYAEVLGPTLVDRKGTIVFCGTPQGMANDLYDKYVYAQSDSEWASWIFPATYTGIIPEEELERAKKQMSDEQYASEYLCSFATSLQGAYYAEAILQARDEGRITKLDWVPSLPVYTAWDLGVSDATSIWFFQRNGNQIGFIDFYENSGEGLGHYVNVMAKKPYVYSIDDGFIGPHDIKVREFGTGKSRWEQAMALGVRFSICPNLSIDDGIEASKLLLKTCWFDAEKCKDGLKSLENYKRSWSEDRQVFSTKPLHDWASNAADAFRYAAIMSDRATSIADIAWETRLPYSDVGIV